jgi:hypothetical protein
MYSKHMKRDQKGFSSVEGLLILIIVGLIGFVGWYVWNSKNKTGETISNTNKSSTSTVAATKIPSDWALYENKTLGISFAYPKNWTFVDKSKTPTETKSYYVGELTSEDKATTVAITLIRIEDGRSVSTSADEWKTTAAKLNIRYSDLTEIKSHYEAFSYTNNVSGITSLNYVILSPGKQTELLVLPTSTNQKSVIDEITGTLHFN